MYKNITILGLGLIGSSVARAVRQLNLAEQVTGYDSNPLPLQLGLEQQFITHTADTVEDAVKQAELIILAAPPSSCAGMISDIARYAPEDALITDVASVKTPIADAFSEYLKDDAKAIPAHPIAGSEKSGAAAGRADLFINRRIILTPKTPQDPGIEDISQFWEALGGVVEYMPPQIHDMVYAYVSHLPQLIAFGYKPFLDKLDKEKGISQDFAQFSRLCHSDIHLWKDIFEQNQEPLDNAMARFLVLLAHIRKELAQNKGQVADKKEISDDIIWTNWLPRLVASCLVATIAQQSSDMGFNFTRFAGSGFDDFVAPLTNVPDADLEAISGQAPAVVAALDELMAELANRVVIKD